MAEISSTVDANSVPVGSATIVNIIGVDEIENSVHSIRIVLFSISSTIDVGNISVRADHIKPLANLLIFILYNMKKSTYTFLNPQLSGFNNLSFPWRPFM